MYRVVLVFCQLQFLVLLNVFVQIALVVGDDREYNALNSFLQGGFQFNVVWEGDFISHSHGDLVHECSYFCFSHLI